MDQASDSVIEPGMEPDTSTPTTSHGQPIDASERHCTAETCPSRGDSPSEQHDRRR